MIPGCGRLKRVLAGLDPEQRTAVTAPGRAGLHPGRRRHRQDPRDHPPDRLPDARRGDQPPARPRGHVHRPGRRRDAGPAHRARRGRRAGPHVPRRRAAPGALLRAPAARGPRRCPSCWRARRGWSGLAAARAGLRADRTGARDLAGEIEWAKSSLVEPGEYAVAAAKALREPPFEPAKVAEVFAAYEPLKRRQGVIDFEDMLRAAVWGIEEHPDVAEQIRSQYRHFVVDEYQDVNPLQQRLLDAWLGGRDDLTVVGDASQTIYSFTGATSSYLIDFPRRRRERGGGPPGPRLPLDPAGGRPGQRGDQAGPRQRGQAAAGAGRAAPARRRARAEDLPGRAGRGGRGRRPLPGADRFGHAGQRDRRAVPDQRAVRERTRRRWPRPRCRTWCGAPSGSSSGPRCARR